MIRCYALIAFVALSAVAPAGGTAPGGATAMPLVARAVAAYSLDVRGVIGLQRHFSTAVDAGIARHSEVSDSGLLLQNGAYVDLRYYRIVDDGHAFAADKVAQRNAQTTADWAAGKVFFKEPYDARYTGDYRFAAGASSALCGNATAVAFSSALRDAQHGDGTMCIDAVTAAVTKLMYVPNALPPHASSGTVTETGGTALAGLWYVTRIDERYSGHAFILHGSATFTGIMDHFKRFASVAEGEAALRSGSI